MSSTPFERPIVLDLAPGRLACLEPALWIAGLAQTVFAPLPALVRTALLVWAAISLTGRLTRRCGGAPRTVRWHPRTGWHLRLPEAGWRPVALIRAHRLGTDLQLLCWRDGGGRRWARLIGPAAASGTVRRRLRVLLRFGRLTGDG